MGEGIVFTCPKRYASLMDGHGDSRTFEGFQRDHPPFKLKEVTKKEACVSTWRQQFAKLDRGVFEQAPGSSTRGLSEILGF